MSRSLRVAVSGLVTGPLLLSVESSHYIAKVHRKQAHELILLFDPSEAKEAWATIVDCSGRQIFVEVAAVTVAPSNNLPLTLYQGVGKAVKPEKAIRDATAFGVQEIVFLANERSVARSKGEGRRERWHRVAEDVARQCERSDLPQVSGPLPLRDVLENLPPVRDAGGTDFRFVCTWHEEQLPLLHAARIVDWRRDHIGLMVGPEGGLSTEETEAAFRAGFQPVSLGPYVLRTEVACTAALGALRLLRESALLEVD